MKKRRCSSKIVSAKVAGCTVSAAALMLGVSQAATVGFNFQANYCAATSYSGAVVTAPAFGIGTNAWESLPQMDTGYGCTAGYYTLNQTIDTSTSGNGLNPLPIGSVQVNWSAYTANCSNFGGYHEPGPHYNFGGNAYPPGNGQVYWGFLRDGVNFGPGSSGGDNNQPGYVIDLTGLNSIFTNGFAVQLIASADSMQYLTNAFIIDATLNSTQSVSYPSTPPVADVGDTAWVRGQGGGLSTATASALHTDHLKIIGNRAAHAGPKTGYNFASTISGFIITDEPVISMSPNSVLANPADNLTLSGYAVGIPPLSYQWRKNGAPVPGATTTSLSLPNAVLAVAGNYDLLVTNLYGRATSSVAVVTVDHIVATPGGSFIVDSNPQNTAQDGINSGATWLASSVDAHNTTRSGVMSFSASATNSIQVPASGTFNSPTGAITFWMRSPGLFYNGGNSAVVLDRRNGNNGCMLVLRSDGTLGFLASGTSISLNTATVVADNNWHQIALTFDQSAGGAVNLYVDGVLDAFNFVNAWSWAAAQPLELGYSPDTADWQPFNGVLDDVRLYNRLLADAEVASTYTGALVDTAALLLRLNFDAAPIPGVMLQWQCPDAVLQSAPSVNGPYIDVPVASPHAVAGQGGAKFFRYRGHVPIDVLSNPYLM